MSESAKRGREPRQGVRGRGRERRGDWRTKHLRAPPTAITFGSYGDSTRVDGRGLSTGPWERFVVDARRGGEIRRRDTIALRTPGGHYVATRGGGGALRTNGTRVDRDSWFALTVE